MRHTEFFRLGYFDQLDDAIAARKEAEQRFNFTPLGEISIDGQSAQETPRGLPRWQSDVTNMFGV